MVPIKPKSGNRFVKRSLITLGVLVILFWGLHLWFVNNARTILKDYISTESKGKIKLELSGLNVNLLINRLQIHEADLLSTDSLNEPITYHVTFSKLSLRVHSVWQLLFHKKLLLDSLKLYNPVVEVMQWRKDTTQVVKDELSIPREMGRLYNSLIGTLEEFEVRRIIIDNAAVSLINKMQPNSETITVSKLFLDLARIPGKKGNDIIYFNEKEKIILKTSHQNIPLSDGRHRLSFKSFTLRLLRQSIELDSCTVTAMATDSLKSSYSVFFKKLLLKGVDFNALSAKNVIKADTVYCENPIFNVSLYRSDAVEKKTKIPDPKKLLRELTGNLDLAFVGVKSAGINFNSYGKTKMSFFNSNKDNFELRNFRINPDSSQPMSIGGFGMTMRDYNLYNEDSSAIFSFDSLHFSKSSIILNNFGIRSSSGRKIVRNDVTIKVPFFELSELDWAQLVFEHKLAAREAVLKDPVINFRQRKAGTPGKKVNLFAALQSLDTLVGLEDVSVRNGQVNMQLGPATSFSIENIDFKIYSNRLFQSTTKEGLRSAVDHLSFTKGVLKLKDFTAQLQNAKYTGNNLVYADKVAVYSKGDKIAATVNKVYIDNIQADDNSDNIEVDGLSWESATVALKASGATRNKDNSNGSSIYLKNLAGNNTKLNFSGKSAVVSTFVKTLNASSLLKKANEVLRVEGLFISGNDLLVNANQLKIRTDSYKVSGSEASSLTGLRVEQIHGRDSLNISSSLVNFSADINDLFANNLHLTNLYAKAPVIKLSKWETAAEAHDSARVQSPVRIDKLTAIEPDITISTHRNDSVAIINIPRSAKSLVNATGIKIGGDMQVRSLIIKTDAATYTKPTGEITGIKKGKISMDVSNIRVGKKDGKMNWSGSINNINLENKKGFEIGKTKNKVHFQKVSLGNLRLSSEILPDFPQLLKVNTSAWLRIPTGEFIDSNKTLKWYNANYNNSSRTISLDSFIYHPTQPLDSVLAYAPYQLDYMTLKTGHVSLAGLDVLQYKKDGSFIANTIKINNPVLTVYRDKKPPSSPFKKDKPLPVHMIKNLSLPVSVQSIQLNDGTITYSEKNGKSRQTGRLLLTNVSGTVRNIKNTHLLPEDSLIVKFHARLMNAADINVILKESYTDSLNGFLMATKMTAADLSVLNPFLAPIANVKIARGRLDSVSFGAVGREDVALGEMNMRYHKLGIQLVKDGDTRESTFSQNMLSFIANTFVLRSNNTKHKGVIYYKHLREQSFVNYMVKMTLSGISSSIGVKKNRKYMKQYKRELKGSNRPAIKL